jgi:alkylation response protein AidB-like acyl-CoA dehydrogenase
VDLQLTEEQRWLSESVDALVAREPAESVWRALVEFGALAVRGDEGLGVVELALVARSVGARLAAVPYVDTAAVHYVVDIGDVSAAPCLSEPGRSFAPTDPSTTFDDGRLTGEKAGVLYASAVDLLAVPASSSTDGLVLALVPAAAAAITAEPTLDPGVRPALVSFDAAEADRVVADRSAVESLAAVGGVLASAEAVGAASTALELARDYASQRRQFGHTIGSFQAIRHLLADMYVKVESSWSSVLYAAAALDEDEPDALRTASIAKAYAARATRDVAHGALQVFGGIAFTAEHPAHRFLRRIAVRAGQFGTAREHEHSLGRSLAHELEVLT